MPKEQLICFQLGCREYIKINFIPTQQVVVGLLFMMVAPTEPEGKESVTQPQSPKERDHASGISQRHHICK